MDRELSTNHGHRREISFSVHGSSHACATTWTDLTITVQGNHIKTKTILNERKSIKKYCQDLLKKLFAVD
jgi:hypothetical protein